MQEERPLVSVVIPAFNGVDFIGQAIESVLSQSYRPLEILVVDDGSTDATREVVERFGEPVRCIHQDNAGTAAARNTGIRAARGEFVALLDQDDLWLPQKLERQMPLFEEDPGTGMVFAAIEIFNESTGEAIGTMYPGDEPDVHDILAHVLIPVQTMVFRRTALESIGPFDTELTGADDWDIAIRAADKLRVAGVRETLARVRLHAARQTYTGSRLDQKAQRVLAKHANLHPGCEMCRTAFRRGQHILRRYRYRAIRDRARVEWNAGNLLFAGREAARAILLHPSVLKRVDLLRRGQGRPVGR